MNRDVEADLQRLRDESAVHIEQDGPALVQVRCTRPGLANAVHLCMHNSTPTWLSKPASWALNSVRLSVQHCL